MPVEQRLTSEIDSQDNDATTGSARRRFPSLVSSSWLQLTSIEPSRQEEYHPRWRRVGNPRGLEAGM